MRVPIPQLPIQTCAHNFRARSTTSRTTGPAISVEICGRKQEQNKRKGGGRAAPAGTGWRRGGTRRFATRSQSKKKKKEKNAFQKRFRSFHETPASAQLLLSWRTVRPSSSFFSSLYPAGTETLVGHRSFFVSAGDDDHEKSKSISFFPTGLFPPKKKKSVLVGKVSGLLKGTRVDH